MHLDGQFFKQPCLRRAVMIEGSRAGVLVRLSRASRSDEKARRAAVVEMCRDEGIGNEMLERREGKSCEVERGWGGDSRVCRER